MCSAPCSPHHSESSDFFSEVFFYNLLNNVYISPCLSIKNTPTKDSGWNIWHQVHFCCFFFLLMHWKQKVSQDEEWETRFFRWQQTNPHSDHASHQVWLWGAVWQGVACCTNTQPQLICQDVWGFITFLQQKDFNIRISMIYHLDTAETNK